MIQNAVQDSGLVSTNKRQTMPREKKMFFLNIFFFNGSIRFFKMLLSAHKREKKSFLIVRYLKNSDRKKKAVVPGISKCEYHTSKSKFLISMLLHDTIDIVSWP